MGAQHPLVHAAIDVMYVCLSTLIQSLQCKVM